MFIPSRRGFFLCVREGAVYRVIDLFFEPSPPVMIIIIISNEIVTNATNLAIK